MIHLRQAHSGSLLPQVTTDSRKTTRGGINSGPRLLSSSLRKQPIPSAPPAAAGLLGPPHLRPAPIQVMGPGAMGQDLETTHTILSSSSSSSSSRPSTR